MFLTNHNQLILDGHGSHVTFKAIKQAHRFDGYFTITYFTCFTTFGCFILQAIQNYIKERERWGLLRNNYNELNKVTLARWLDRELDQ
jgi:hypothetical protein